jgi:tRNA-splicing ligase RtcB
MKNIIQTEKIPIHLWLNDLEEGALLQALNLANLPFAFHHIAIMPDAHQGFGMPIGGVLATEHVVVPNAVGVDIGCGMCSLRTNLHRIDTDELKKVMESIRKLVPVGFKHHSDKQPETAMPAWPVNQEALLPISKREYEKALRQVGTLGGGNHFIELQQGSDGFVWIMIHSGSRNIGLQVAEYYHNLAVQHAKKRGETIPTDLSFFKDDEELYHAYLAEMQYCIGFALANRKRMMERVKQAITDVMGDVYFDGFINKPHNFADLETHFGKQVLVHRKGATRARKGELGMIPGSQGSSSYIVKGLGNPMSFESCSHGAGRVMSRNAARKKLDLEKEKQALDKRGILHAIRGRQDLDEAPSSYKNIEKVMANQKDLVEIDVALSPLAVVKG